MSKETAAHEVVAFALGLPGRFEALHKAAAAKAERISSIKEALAVAELKLKAQVLKEAAAEPLGPPQDPQNVGQPATQAAIPPQEQATLEQLMGTPDVQRWFGRSVEGLGKRAKTPYALVRPGQPATTNMDHAAMVAALQQLLAQHPQPQA